MITKVHAAHCDNAKYQYYAKLPGRKRISIMPLTPLVFEFFLFNSLYQVDWAEVKDTSDPKYHPRGGPERQKQQALLDFLIRRVSSKPAIFYRSFEPLIQIENLQGAWTRVTPDSRVTSAKGDEFFRKLRELQSMIEECKSPSQTSLDKRVSENLDDCIDFIYMVRNNIYHGSKTFGVFYDLNQKRRLEVYDLFLKCINSLFFLANGEDVAACDFVPCPVYSSSLPAGTNHEIADQEWILEATFRQYMKIGDSRLIFKFARALCLPAPRDVPNAKASLFYPSAGEDLLTPVLLGLPYCTQFYFFEKSDKKPPEGIGKLLSQLNDSEASLHSLGWVASGYNHLLDFMHNGIRRRLHLVRADNMKFLTEDAELKFYFHRGDSYGEGGSGQKWDSTLLPELLKKSPANSNCFFLTDGEPGGLDESHTAESLKLDVPFIERGRRYYMGKLLGAKSGA